MQLIFSLAVAIALVVPSTGYALSLKQAIAHAVRTNPQIDVARATRRATDHVLEQAEGRFLPEINLNADLGYQKIDRPNGFGPDDNNQWRRRRQATLNIRQHLFDGWERANELYQAQARISGASYKVLARSEIIALNVVEAYIDVVRHQNLIQAARANVKRHKILLARVRERVRGGKNVAGDLEQTKERLQASQALVSQIQISIDSARARFKGAVGKRARKLRRVKSAKLGFKSAAAATRYAINHNPRLQAMRSEIDVAGFETEKFAASLYPQLSLEGSARMGSNLDGTEGRSNELRGMFMLRWKLFDGGVREARISELTERKYVEIAKQDAFIRELTVEVETAWSRAVVGRKQVATIARQLAQNNKVVRAYRNEYEADRRSLLDVLDAENSRFASQFDLSNVSAIQLFSTYQMAAHTGRLLKMFNIGRPAGSEGAVPPPRLFTKSRKRNSFIIPSLK